MGYTKIITIEPINTAAPADEDTTYLASIPKEPTPLLGSWADVWSSRQTSEIILEDIDKEKAAPADAEEMTPTASSVSAHEETGAAAHARHVYSYNPYCYYEGRVDIYVCECADCAAANRSAHAEIAAQRAAATRPPHLEAVVPPRSPSVSPVSPAQYAHALAHEAPSPIKLASPAQPPAATGGFQTHSFIPPPPPHPSARAAAAAAAAAAASADPYAFDAHHAPASRASYHPRPAPAHHGAYDVDAVPPPIPPHQLSVFMPPPPPSTMTADVLARGGTANSKRVVQNVMARWYSKVCATQFYFVAETDPCPEPESADFETWCQICADWWFRNFEFAQMKPTAFATNYGYSTGYDAGYAPHHYAEHPQEVW